MKFAIVGAGMAGLSCATALRASGHEVRLFDKGRGPGGRMSTRRLVTPLGEVAIDHGAQYFTARHPAFREQVSDWHAGGLAVPWSLPGQDAWIGVPGMSAIIRAMAESHDVSWSRLVAGMKRAAGAWWLVDDTGTTGPFDAVILAIPAEQAAALLSLHDFDMARVALAAPSQPCWTSMFVFDRPQDSPQPLFRKRGIIGWAVRNNAKPGRAGPEAWVVQATVHWSTTHLEDSDEAISTALCTALAGEMGQTALQPVAAVSHRWRYARSAASGDGALWNAEIGLGACGDWLLGPRIECAWLSGRLLADRCLHRLSEADAGTVRD